MEKTDQEIVSDYLMGRLHPKTISYLADILKSPTAIITQNIIIDGKDAYVLGIYRHEFTTGLEPVLFTEPNSPYVQKS